MDDIVRLITELGFPVAAALGLGIFVWKLINRIIDGMESKIDVVDDKVNEQLKAMEGRLQQKLDSQQSILVSLIDRVRSASPYFSEFGEIRYDFLGEPDKKPGTTLGRLINPFMVTEDTGDIVYEALNDLNHTITPPPQAKNGIQYSEFILPDEKNKNAYEKYNELIGTVTIDGKTLRQAFSKKIFLKIYIHL